MPLTSNMVAADVGLLTIPSSPARAASATSMPSAIQKHA